MLLCVDEVVPGLYVDEVVPGLCVDEVVPGLSADEVVPGLCVDEVTLRCRWRAQPDGGARGPQRAAGGAAAWGLL